MNKKKQKAAIIFFVKAPVPGKVKTRLARKIGAKTAAFLYENFVKDIYSTLAVCGQEIRVYFFPEKGRDLMTELLGAAMPLYLQHGDDLGQKMEAALNETFKAGYEKAVIIGSDIPDISKNIICGAIAALNNYPAVTGPATDGGYYLIGFNKYVFKPGLFSNIAWGGSEVFLRTKDLLNKNKITFFTLPVLRDIDTWRDLRHFMNKKEQLLKTKPYTFNALKKAGLLPGQRFNADKEVVL